MAHHDQIIVPRAAIIATGLLMLSSLIIAGVARQTRLAAAAEETPAPQTALLLTFGETEDGNLTVERSDGTALSVAPESHGFVQGVLRTFTRARQRAQKDVAAPLELGLYANGSLMLSDPETGERVELDSFGPTNRQAFARLFAAPRGETARHGAPEARR